AAPQLDLYAHCLFAALEIFEERDHAVFLADRRTLDIERIFQSLELDRAVNAHIGTRAPGQFAVDRDIYWQGSLCRSGGDAHHVPFDDAFARIALTALPEGDIFFLVFCDAVFGFQLRGVTHRGEIGADRALLPLLNRHILHHAIEAGADFQRIELL